MSARMLPAAEDPIGRDDRARVRIEVDGETLEGVRGQTIAGVLLAADRTSWRTTAGRGAPRGLFCGIGVCFECLVEVDGVRDVRACRRLACDGAVVRTAPDDGGAAPAPGPGADEGVRR